MRIDASRFINIKPEMQELLKNMEAGDVLKGRVLEAIGNSITIRATGGQVFMAELPEGTIVPKGAQLELAINDVSDGRIYAELKTEEKAMNLETKIAGLLNQLGLPVDDKNTEAAKLMVKYKLPFEKDTLIKITGMQKSIESLNQSEEGRVALLLSGLDIKNTPVDTLNRIVLGWSADMVSGQGQEGTAAAPSNRNSLEDLPAGLRIVVEEELPSSGKVNVGIIADNNEEEQKQATTESVLLNSRAASESEATAKMPFQAAFMENGAVIEAEKGASLLKVLNSLGIDTGEEAQKLAGKVEDILASIRNTDMEALTYLVSKEMKVTPGNLKMLLFNIENEDGISKFLDRLQAKLEGSDSQELREIKDSIRKVFLDPEKLEGGREASEQLKDIASLGEKLESYLGKTGDKDPEIREALSNLRDSIDFLRNINQNANYLQLPVIINGDNSTAKLYVFREGKQSRRIDPQDATIVLSLDLSSLGHLESMVKVKGRSVNVTFRVESKEIGSIIEKNHELLRQSLNEKGYSLNPVRVISLGQPFSLLSMEAMTNESSSEKIHFDMRV
ncbi:MAG TPA: flagellar hook-length control protein FliK [Negativicutes bacterium]|nr:flagellar hook-length control protein FliK [Negativicutes bacterium]